jgi:hypothetical protein
MVKGVSPRSVSSADVAKGIVTLVEKFTLDHTGQFFKWTGEQREV